MAINKDAAITEFVKRNFDFLTSTNFDRELYKRYHREYFFEKYNRKFGMPSPKEICESLIIFLKHRGLSLSTIIGYFEELPIFNQLGENVYRKMLSVLIREKRNYKSSIDEKDLNKIKNHDAYQAVLKHKEKEIEAKYRQKEEEWEKKIDRKKEEYDSLESILDKEVIEEPDFDPEYELEKPWWERLYLKSNPFPQKDGLSSVDQDLYEAVVVKTKPFIRTLSNFERDGSYLFVLSKNIKVM